MHSKITWPSSLVLLCLVLQGCSGQSGGTAQAPTAAVPPPSTSSPIHEFRRVGGSLGCALSREETDWIQRGGSAGDIGYKPCLTIGSVKMDMPRSDVERVLGPHNRIVPSQSGEHRTYLIRVQDRTVAYWVISYVGDQVSAIQITGGPTAQPRNFSGLALGDSVIKVTQTLGPPSSKSPVQQSGAELWNYDPFPISLEVRAGVITSMRAALPGR